MSIRTAPPVTQASRTPEQSYQRGLGLLALLGAGLLCLLGGWARLNWNDAVAAAQTDQQRLAAVNTLPVALALRDARRAAESADAALAASPPPDAQGVRQLLAAQLGLRFQAGEMADLLQPGGGTLLASTAPDSFDPAQLAPQLGRVTQVQTATPGWAYQRGNAWWLPLFYLRDGGQMLVISLPVNALFAQWMAPALPGENPVGLRAADDRVLLRRPFTAVMMGADARTAASSRLMNEARARGATAGAVRAVATETDSVERLIGWAEVPGTDLRVLVAAGTDNLFAQWGRTVAPKFLAMAAFITLAMGGAALSLRQQYRLGRRERQALAEAQRAQARLEEGAATLDRMCSLARIGPWEVDPASGKLQMSTVARSLYGLAPDAVLPNWHDFHPADEPTRQRVQAAREQLLQRGVGYDLVLPLNRPDGERRWVRSVAAAHFTHGAIDRVDGAVQDVTDQVRAQEALDSQYVHLRMLAEAVSGSSQLLLVTDTAQNITWCNGTFMRKTGYTLDEIRGQRPGALLQRGTVPAAINALMRRQIAACEPFSGIRVQNFSKAGRPYWVDLEVRPLYDAQGRLHSYLGVQTDVTHDIEREHALRETTRRFELATAHAGIGVYELDVVQRTKLWSETTYRLFGFDPAGPVPSTEEVDARVLPEDRTLRGPAFQRAMDDVTQPQWSAEFRVRRPDGHVAWLHSRCQIERDGSGRALRALGTVLDITHARSIEAERRARSDAEARSQAKTAFLSRMSHELRTPLHAVIGYSQLLNSAPNPLPPDAAPYVQRIETAGWHLLALIDDVLELARIESNAVAMPLEAVALHDVVRDAITFVEPLAEQACLLFEVTLEPLVVRANTTRARQVLVNLLSNAIKYNIAAGSVRVTMRAEGGQACVDVADTGLGMTESQLAGLYEPFNRLGREQSGVEGTGIGLAITKGLVEQMGGSLSATSRINEGSCFTVALPLADAAAAAALQAPVASAPATPAAAPAPTVVNVLCLEDNEINAYLLGELLGRLRPHWSLRIAATGAEATHLLREASADLVFLDLNLPDTNGLTWLESMRANDLVHHAEVVLLTADVMPQTRVAAELAGLRHFLSKPFLMVDFEHLLDDLDATRAVPATTPAAA